MRLPGVPLIGLVGDDHDAAVGRRDDGAGFGRNFALGIAEEVKDEEGQRDKNDADDDPVSEKCTDSQDQRG